MQNYHSQNLIKELHQSITLNHQPIRPTSKLLSFYSLQYEQKQEQKISHHLFSSHSTHLKQTSSTQRKFSKFKGFSDRKVKIEEGESSSSHLCWNVKSKRSGSEMSDFDNETKNVQKGENYYQNCMDAESSNSHFHPIKRVKSMDDLYKNNGRHPKFIPKCNFLKVKLKQTKQSQRNGENSGERQRRSKGVERVKGKEGQQGQSRNLFENRKGGEIQKYCQNCNKLQMGEYNLYTAKQQLKSICQSIKKQKQKFKQEMAIFLDHLLNYQRDILAQLAHFMALFYEQSFQQKESTINFDYSISQSIDSNHPKTYSPNKKQILTPLKRPITFPATGTDQLFQNNCRGAIACSSQSISILQGRNQVKFQQFDQKLNFCMSEKQLRCETMKKQTTKSICSNTPKIQILTESYNFDLQEQIDTLFHKQLQQSTQQKVEGHRQNTLQNIEETCQQIEQEILGCNLKSVTRHLIGEQFDWNKMMSNSLAAKQ